ncbi:MAG: hypothetical protein K0S39_4082 [Paenibacillus sp.]|nr:hypothetical protein [Paenibacillus sp.]
MSNEIKIVAVGDILMSTSLIESSKIANHRPERYDFSPIFQHAAPILQDADLTIGNLEIPLAGREQNYTRRHPRTGFFTFNCPDELAPCLKNVGFDVLTTANNHCLDRGFAGLCRTLNVLDQWELSHTGTYRTKNEANSYFLKDVNGIKVGILAYSKSTNKISIPDDKKWCVNLIDEGKMIRDLQEVKKHADLVIVCVHFGREYRHMPSGKQKQIVRMLFNHGANIVLGSHPHVIQPSIFVNNKKFAMYSLGNFISTTLNKNVFTRNGVLAQLTITKDAEGEIQISGVNYIPSWVKIRSAKKNGYQVIPVADATVSTCFHPLTSKERLAMQTAAKHTLQILHLKVY